MKLLYLAENEDGPYLDRFSRLAVLRGVQVAVSRGTTIRTSSDVSLLAKSVGADAVVCSRNDVVRLVLESQYDYIPPNTKRGVTLDDYAGSILTLHAIPNLTPQREFLVLNPPKQLHTVAHGPFVFERYLSKLTNPESWLPEIPFKWKVWDPNVEDCSEFVRICRNADLMGVDIETAIDDPERRINCVGYAAYNRATNTCHVGVVPFTSWAAVCLVRELNALDVPKITQGGLYDNAYFARWGCPLRYWIWDTLHLFHSWLSELPKRLDFVAAFSTRKIRYWKDDGSTGNLHDYYRYNALDCWATVSAFLGVMKEIPDWGMKNYTQEFPLVFPCHHCELEGVKADVTRMEEAKVETEQAIEDNLKRLRFMLDSPGFNPNSPPQTLALFKILGLVLPSTDKASMLKAKASSPFNERILTFVTDIREDRKLVSNYLNLEKVWNGRILYRLDPAGTDTGRLASSQSSFWCGVQIQNAPRTGPTKECYIADDGWLLLEIDKAQSEARCVGYLSGETGLITLVEDPTKDYHTFNASAFFGVLYEEVTKILRDLAKRTNHGANYNMGPDVMLDTMGPKNVIRAKTALRLPIKMRLRDVCGYLLERYSATYPRVKGLYYQDIVKRIVLSGKLTSALGWTRKFFGRPDKNKLDLNAAVAHEPQNLSVGIINKEFFRIWESSIYGELKGIFRLKAQIHDSIFGQFRDSAPHVPTLIRDKYMNSKVEIVGADKVKRTMFIPSDISAGKKRWSELK